MATYFVNALSGNDSNSGASWVLAKKTLSGVNAVAVAGDTIICTGVFREAIPGSKLMAWIGFGHCEFNGNGSLAPCLPIVNISFKNIIFENWLTAPFKGAGSYFQDCVFRNMPSGFDGTGANNYTLNTAYVRCLFYNCSTAGINGGDSYNPNVWLNNCTFYGNTIDLNSTSTLNGWGGDIRNCCFGSPIMVKTLNNFNLFGGANCDNNIYDFTNGKCVYNSVDKTSLAAWQAMLTTPRERNSINRVWRADVEDYANFLLKPNPSSYLLTASLSSGPIGLIRPSFGISNNVNSSLWTGGVFSNTELDGSNYLVLSAGQTIGTWASDVADFTTSTTLNSINPIVAGENYPTTYLDTDTGDSPNYLNLEVRGSDTLFLKTDVSPAWITMPRGAEVGGFVATNKFRYWQVRLTLRG